MTWTGIFRTSFFERIKISNCDPGGKQTGVFIYMPFSEISVTVPPKNVPKHENLTLTFECSLLIARLSILEAFNSPNISKPITGLNTKA